jgi:hypothetical protein
MMLAAGLRALAGVLQVALTEARLLLMVPALGASERGARLLCRPEINICPQSLASADARRTRSLLGWVRMLPIMSRARGRRGIDFVPRLVGIVAPKLSKWVTLAEQPGELRERITGARLLVLP